jgi:hypothetical protein
MYDVYVGWKGGKDDDKAVNTAIGTSTARSGTTAFCATIDYWTRSF